MSEEAPVLEGRNLKSIAKYIKSDKCKNVFVLAGAGISTSAGIPDFRSPETGLYANLEKFDLPFPEAVFDIRFFRENPAPFYALAKELEPGRYRPTLTHAFIKLLNDRGLLHTCFTQNIDTLERRAGIPANKIIEAHGSFATHACIDCKTSFSDKKMKEAVESQKVPRCESPGCGGLVKPNIVFFGEGLPVGFFKAIPTLQESNLTIILGTSLSVYPFAALPDVVPESSPRLLINLEEVGDIGSRPYDVIALGDCDSQVRKLCQELGDDWEDQLDRIWAEAAGILGLDKEDVSSDEDQDQEQVDLTTRALTGDELAAKQAKAKELEERIEAIAKEVEDSLKISEDHKVKVTEELSRGGIESTEGTSDQKMPTVKPSTPAPVSNDKKTDSPSAPEDTKAKPVAEPSMDAPAPAPSSSPADEAKPKSS